jgi:hypothetical protein
MTLAQHAVVGASLASFIPNQPATAFAIGFLSHFLLDAIPHWDYDLKSRIENEHNPMNIDMVLNYNFLTDILKIGFDAIIGLILSYFIFIYYLKISVIVILAGSIGGMLPDALQFVYMKWKHEPLTSLQKFHIWVHSKR